MNAHDIMSSPVITVLPDVSVQEVAHLMLKNHISGVPVVDSAGGLLGTVTELDLIVRNAPLVGPNYISLLSGLIPVDFRQYRQYKEQLRKVLATTVEQLMTKDAPSIEPSTDLEEIMAFMERPETVLLPVVEADVVIGIVTRTDLVRLLEKLEGTQLNDKTIEESGSISV